MKSKAPRRNFIVRLWDKFWFARHFVFTTDAPPNIAAEMIRRIPVSHPGMNIALDETERNSYRFRIDRSVDAILIGRIYRDEDQTFIEGKARFEMIYPLAIWLVYPLSCIVMFMLLLPLDALNLIDAAKISWLIPVILPALLCLGLVIWFRRQREKSILALIEAVKDMEVMHRQWESHGRAVLPPRDLPEAPASLPHEQPNKSKAK